MEHKNSTPSSIYSHHTGEYAAIRSDLVRLFLINAVFLAGVIALFYANRSSGVLEKIIGRYLPF